MVNRDTIQIMDQQRLLRELIQDICSGFDRSYWGEKGLQRESFLEFTDGGWFMQYPLTEALTRVQTAKGMVYNATSEVSDATQKNIGALVNISKFLAADAAIQSHGGFGVAREYNIERFFSGTQLTKLDAITQELALNYLGENVLGLPRSY